MFRLFVHKYALITLGVLFNLAALVGNAHAQNSEQHLLQAAVDGLRNAHHAEQASNVLRDQQGVLMARFDPHTRNMMLHVDAELAIDRHTINGLLQETGISVRCLKREVVGAAPFRHVDADNCRDLVPASR